MNDVKSAKTPALGDDAPPWSGGVTATYRLASDRFDVFVSDIELEAEPAALSYVVSVGSLKFATRMTYSSIPNWDDLEQFRDLVPLVVSWDAMRFLALGGERLVLPKSYGLPQSVKDAWRVCFLNQFSEWRYRNCFAYRSTEGPLLECDTLEEAPLEISSSANTRWLLSNGGGKDTLAGMLLLNDVGVPYDVYEGCTPVGGGAELQDQLLSRFRSAVTPDSLANAVSVVDDFYDRPVDDFHAAGVEVDFYKTDFAIGHTANYAGLFPLIAHHGYSGVWFNIEGSADDYDIMWNNERINHEWCKSAEYQQIMTDVFKTSIGGVAFEGFKSTLRGLTDTMIYRIVSSEPELLALSHSCNYDKPWCARCPKCCFCYLMMAAELGESFAQRVMGIDHSLFNTPALADVWTSLLSTDEVAWECVASPEECALAVARVLDNGCSFPNFEKYAPTEKRREELEAKFTTVKWSQLPEMLRAPLRNRLDSPATIANYAD